MGTSALLVGLVALLIGLAVGKAWERYKLHDGVWHVQLLDEGFQDFRIAIAQESERHALFDHMVAMVNRLLSAKPWDGVEKLPIGFELTHPDLSPDGEAPEPALAQP